MIRRITSSVPQCLLLASLATGLTWRSAAAVDVTSCGQTVAPGEVGILQADLDCSTSPLGVRLLRDATLELNGHTITGGDSTFAIVAGVTSTSSTNPIGSGAGRFTIAGPGVLMGTVYPPSLSVGTRACVVVNDGRAVITGTLGTVEIRNCIYGVRGGAILTNDGQLRPQAPNGRARVTMDHVDVRHTGDGGVVARRITATDTTVSENHGIGMSASTRLNVTNVTANDNGNVGLFARNMVVGTQVTTLRNDGSGVDACLDGPGRVTLTNLVSMNNMIFGVCGARVGLVDSTVTGNGARDVSSETLPILENTTCGTSRGPYGPWGVCTSD